MNKADDINPGDLLIDWVGESWFVISSDRQLDRQLLTLLAGARIIIIKHRYSRWVKEHVKFT